VPKVTLERNNRDHPLVSKAWQIPRRGDLNTSSSVFDRGAGASDSVWFAAASIAYEEPTRSSAPLIE